tara:strand:+ start:241 stop:681 length:441 start_codon:yes stop_codon:yes gene_type:complete
MMVVTVMDQALTVVQLVVQLVVHRHAMIVNLIGLHTVLSAVIQHGTSLVLTVQHLKVHTAGIVLDVAVLVTMVAQLVVQLVVTVATVLLERLKTVMVQVSVSLNHGLVMAYVMELIKRMVQIYVATITMVATVLMLNVQAAQILAR